MITTGGIYGIKNYGDENFYYIGKTKNNFYARWGQHIAGISRDSAELPWYGAEKENVDKIDFTILYDCRKTPIESDKDLLELENKFIQKYQPKYNIRGRVKEYNDDKRKKILIDFFKDKDGILLTNNLREKFCNELKELGFCDKNYRKTFTFDYIIKRCREYEICEFRTASANKKDCKNNPELEYRKKYLRIVLKNRINFTPSP